MNKPAPRRPGGNAPTSTASGAVNRSARIESPLPSGTHVARYVEQLQRIAAGSLQAMAHDADIEREELRASGSPQDWLSLQVNFVAEQWMRTGEMGSQMLAAWLDLQTGLARDAETALAACLQPWVAGPGAAAPAAPTLCGGTAADGPAFWLRAWLDAPRLMLNAIGHDLQAEPARTAA